MKARVRLVFVPISPKRVIFWLMDGIIQQVKARRKQLGVTLRDVAELSGIGAPFAQPL